MMCVNVFELAYLSFRSTGVLSSANVNAGSSRMAFQLPTPCCKGSCDEVSKHFSGGEKRAAASDAHCGHQPTLLQPATNILVSSMLHFLRCFFLPTGGPIARGTAERDGSVSSALAGRRDMTLLSFAGGEDSET